MTKLSRSIFFVSFRKKIKSGYDVEIVISNFFTALYLDTGPPPHSVQIIIHLRFYLSTYNRYHFETLHVLSHHTMQPFGHRSSIRFYLQEILFLIDEQYGFLPRPVRLTVPYRGIPLWTPSNIAPATHRSVSKDPDLCRLHHAPSNLHWPHPECPFHRSIHPPLNTA